MSLRAQPASVNRPSAPLPQQLPLFPDDAPIQTDFRKVPNAFARHFRDADLSYGQACMVNAIRSHARKNHLPAPSLARVALELHTDVRQVQRWLKEMERDGLVVIHERQGLHGQLANAYDFTPLFRRCAEIAAALKESRPAEATNVGEVPEEQYPIAWEAPAPVEIAAEPVQESTTPPVVKNTTPLEIGTYVPRERERTNDPPTPMLRPQDQTRPGTQTTMEEQALTGPMERIAAEFGDNAPLMRTVRQVETLRQSYGLTLPRFLTMLGEVRLCVQVARAPIDNPMGFYLGSLENACRDEVCPRQRRPRRSRRRPQDPIGQVEPSPPPSAPPSDLWAAIAVEAGQVMTAENVARWFVTASQVEHVGDVLTVAVPNDFHQQWLDVRLRRAIDRCAMQVQPGLQVRFVVQEVNNGE